MPRCTFCKQNYEFPRGLTLILNDGNLLYFCSSKCRRNALHLKRDNKKVNWVRKAEAAESSEAPTQAIVELKKEEKKAEVKKA
jgi:large subunit ribosomal protein L24e